MKILNFLFGLFLINQFIVTSTSYATDPCSLLENLTINLETKDGVISTIGKICGRLTNLITQDYFNSLKPEEEGIYFTRKVGFYYTLDCSSEDSNRLERIGLFGVGDLFKPIKKKIISGEEYFFGPTRTGLYVLVRKDFLRKMEKDLVYLFNKNFTPVEFCTNGNNCGGNNREINARFHYAAMNKEAFVKSNIGDNCVKLDVSVYNGMKDPGLNNELEAEYDNVELEYCFNDHKNGIYAKEQHEVDEIFNDLPITGQYMIFSSQSLRDKIPFIITRKDCQNKTTITKNTTMSLGGSIGAGADFKVIKTEGSGAVKIQWTSDNVEIFDQDKQYLYQSYTSVEKNKDSGNTLENTVINDIQITQNCDGKSIPTKLKEIIIYISPNEKKMLSVNPEELDTQAREKINGAEIWLTASSTSRNKGRAWLIGSLKQQQQWRELIFNKIYRDLDGVLALENDDPIRIDYAFYYTSLLMSTVFEYVPENEIKNITIVDW